jgi:tripartite-type tricarboxylate transporter receptor subunit TctC
MSHRQSLKSFAAAILLAAASMASAQTFPSKSITVVVPFPPGGVTDSSVRQIGQKITESTGQTVIVDNRPGAGGQIGAGAVKSARPDGYTVFLSNIGSHAINETLYTKLSYDPLKDFESVTLLFSSANLVLVPNSSPAKNMAELIALAKSMGGKMTYASQSIGSGGHISGEIVKSKNKVELVHVPYKGSAPALIDIVAGRVDFLFDPIITALPFAKDGKLRALGITSEKRSPLAPEIPTLREQGFTGYDVNPWFGISAPAGTPRPVIDRLNAEFRKAMANPELVKRMTEQGIDISTGTPEEYTAFIKSEIVRWGEVVKASGAKAD